MPVKHRTQYFFNKIVESEVARVEETYSKTHEHVVSAVKEVSSSFLEKVMDVNPPSQPHTNLTHKNPQNNELQRHTDTLEGVCKKLQTEIGTWMSVKEKYEAEAENGPRPEATDLTNLPKQLSEEDKKFLSENCRDVLSGTVPQAFQAFSSQSDVLLRSLRRIRRSIEESEQFQKQVADQANRQALGPTLAEDPKNLISTLINGA